MAFDPDDCNPIGRNSASGNIIWVYHSSTDTLATIKTASYFNDTNKNFAINDIIFVVGSDGCTMLCISAIGGGGGVTAPPVEIEADEVTTDTLADIGQGTQTNVQEALADAYAAINLKLQSVQNIGTGSSVFRNIDATDPTDRTVELARINGTSTIGVGTVGDSIEISATNALLRTVTSFGSGQSIVRSSNNAGDAELRSLSSSDGTLTFGTAGGGTEVNIRVDSIEGVDANGEVNVSDTDGVKILSGSGSPEGSVSASPGSLYLRTNPADAQSIGYLKLSGTGNTGWQTIDT